MTRKTLQNWPVYLKAESGLTHCFPTRRLSHREASRRISEVCNSTSSSVIRVTTNPPLTRPCAALGGAGIRCWIAPRDILPGVEWGRSIIEAIEQTKIMVLVVTANANDSPQIRREVERAVNHGVAILPFRVEDVVLDKSLEYFIGNVHWLDAFSPPLEAHLKSLAGTRKTERIVRFIAVHNSLGELKDASHMPET